MEALRRASHPLSRNIEKDVYMANCAQNIVFIVHYFPPINSTGAKRVEALSKYFARFGRSVTVITTRKRTGVDSTEEPPSGIRLYEMDALGRLSSARETQSLSKSKKTNGSQGLWSRAKGMVMRTCGQIPDPRLPFAFGFISPFLAPEIVATLRSADVVIASMPPWPVHLAALFSRWRFNCRIVLDYRDQFSDNHIMPGSRGAKWLERHTDGYLARRADQLVVISAPMAEYYGAFNPRVNVILNGYDAELIDEIRASCRVKNRKLPYLVVRYLGKMSKDRIPSALISALSNLIKRGEISQTAIKFEFYGECSQLYDYLQNNWSNIVDVFAFHPPVPYRRAIELMLTADYLLFSETSDQSSTSARGVLTTKLFEYLACEKPILAELEPKTEAGQFLQKAGDFHFVSKSTAFFESLLVDSRFWAPGVIENSDWVQTLSRHEQAKQYLEMLDGQTQIGLN